MKPLEVELWLLEYPELVVSNNVEKKNVTQQEGSGGQTRENR